LAGSNVVKSIEPLIIPIQSIHRPVPSPIVSSLNDKKQEREREERTREIVRINRVHRSRRGVHGVDESREVLGRRVLHNKKHCHDRNCLRLVRRDGRLERRVLRAVVHELDLSRRWLKVDLVLRSLSFVESESERVSESVHQPVRRRDDVDVHG